MTSKAQETYIIDVNEGGNALATETLTRVPSSKEFTSFILWVFWSCFFSP